MATSSDITIQEEEILLREDQPQVQNQNEESRNGQEEWKRKKGRDGEKPDGRKKNRKSENGEERKETGKRRRKE